jgi:hypothetical protein
MYLKKIYYLLIYNIINIYFANGKKIFIQSEQLQRAQDRGRHNNELTDFGLCVFLIAKNEIRKGFRVT